MAFLQLLLPLINLSLASSSSALVPRNVLEVRQSTNVTGPFGTGDHQCSRFMCITAVVEDTSIEYRLSSNGNQEPGWLGIGFGTSMSDNTGMVVIWPNSDGSFTLSQRTSSGYVMPTLDTSPDRVATLLDTSMIAGNYGTFAFTTNSTSATSQNIIWAFGGTNPGSSSPSANFAEHIDSGTMVFDLTASVDLGPGSGDFNDGSLDTGSGSGTSSDSTDDGYSNIAQQPVEKMLLASLLCMAVLMHL